MHQPIITIDPLDVDQDTPFCDMPFAKWLGENREPVFHTALRKYLGLDQLPRESYRGCLTSPQINTMRHCHSYTWFQMHRAVEN